MTTRVPSIKSNSVEQNLSQLWRSDPWRHYYNLNGLTDIVLTCDVDWAPDFAVELVLELAKEYGCKITVFATHPSELLASPPEHVEVGLHPDFTRISDRSDYYRKLATLKEHYPNAVGTRSHRNVFGQNISDSATKCELSYDISTLLWNQPLCQVHKDYNGLVKLCYMWEEGIHMDMGLPFDWEQVSLHTPGLKVFNVHPMLMYLNSATDEHRKQVTDQYSDLTIAKKADVDRYVRSEVGIRDLWIALLDFVRSQNIKTHWAKEVALAKR